MSPRPTFATDDTAFKVDLRTRIDGYFSRTGKSRHADGRMIIKTIAFLGAAVGLMTLLLSGVLPALAALPVVMLLGLVVAGLGFNIGHDAVHGAYSSHKLVNRVLGFIFDVLGASSYNWSRAHNIVHHTYTNVPGTDHDLEPGPFLLLHPRPWCGRARRITGCPTSSPATSWRRWPLTSARSIGSVDRRWVSPPSSRVHRGRATQPRANSSLGYATRKPQAS
jgi:fatty acid desaturase